MFDINEKPKKLLANWILQNISDIDFSSIYDPFSGNAKFGYKMKKMGYQVITSDVLQCNYWWNKGIIENKETIISPETMNDLIKDANYTTLFDDWTDSFFTAEESSTLDLWAHNLSALDISEEEKALVYVAVYLTIDYWITYNKRYFQNKPLNHSEILFNYMNQVNLWVFDNGMPNISYYYDSYDIASDINTEAVYLYPPSKDGFRNYNIRFYLWECWTRKVSQLNLEGVIAKADHPKLGETFNSDEDYDQALSSFLEKLQANPIWVISYNDISYPSKTDIKRVVSNFREVTKEVEVDIPYPTAAGTASDKEGLIIAVAR